jgi:acetyltransferase-like isoleucine patch superfamily enzyme
MLRRVGRVECERSVRVEPGVVFEGSGDIRLADRSVLRRGVRLRAGDPAASISVGRHCDLDRDVDIRTHRDGHVEIGDHVYIGPFTCLSGRNISVGHNCLIASHVSIYANNHVFSDARVPIRTQGHTYKGIAIDDDVWVGSGVRLADGVRLGTGCVVGAGAVVTQDVPPLAVAVGVPARVIGYRGAADTPPPASAVTPPTVEGVPARSRA